MICLIDTEDEITARAVATANGKVVAVAARIELAETFKGWPTQ